MEKKDYRWLPVHMPKVADIVADMRAKWGAEWVAQCWAKGVVQGLPGHFFAAEGTLSIGTPASAGMLTEWHELRQKLPGASIVHVPAPSSTSPAAGASHVA